MHSGITSIPPPHAASRLDRVIWARSSSGAFSVCSAYWTLKEASWNPKNEGWKPIWKYASPQLIPTSSSDDTWVCLSIDGAVPRDSGNAAAGGVVRDLDGNWIVDFNRVLGLCTPFEAEVWGILDGILILLNKGYMRATIMTDNLEVAQVLTDLNLEDFGISVLRRSQHIMKAEGSWRIKHIPRCQNLVANCLAKLSLSWKSSLQILNGAPKEIIDLLRNDITNGCCM
ncbi:hypothetical protein J1N35_014021 [Gossypium stocksii]|uniref:RNase H type-1 domain-containing protein n=1 Tax=Gossypium stocksii TaxID=47602 RepID=A0A9D4A8G9_9ROSI|nr:hypothetical protein J1N35_014021 [Gossypium stocksii]